MSDETAGDYTLTYDVSTEAWYALTDRDAPRIGVHRSHAGGGVAWEFSVEERDLSGPTLLLRMFDDSWDAFADVPELFEVLRTETPHTLTELRVLLGQLGFVDITKRDRPPDMVAEPARLPSDARDRIERALRAYDGHVIPEVAHHIMLALTVESR
jgi:hypothetical protein